MSDGLKPKPEVWYNALPAGSIRNFSDSASLRRFSLARLRGEKKKRKWINWIAIGNCLNSFECCSNKMTQIDRPNFDQASSIRAAHGENLAYKKAYLFWNQILTWVSLKSSDCENIALSLILKYCFALNLRSNDWSWLAVNGVRGLRLLLCLRSVHFTWLSLGELLLKLFSGGEAGERERKINLITTN